MKAFVNSRPVLGFILLTFAITFGSWFLPVVVDIPRDIRFAMMLMGGCGPMVSGYVITLLHSGARVRIGSRAIFFAIGIGVSVVLILRMFLANKGLGNVNGWIPALEETGTMGYVLLALVVFFLALHASNATAGDLRENYISSYLFRKTALTWYCLAIFSLPVLSLLSYYAGKALGLETSDFALKIDAAWFVGLFSTFFFFGGNEEFGWRGFLQKELQKKYSPLVTAFIISFFWSAWHLPLHYNGFYSTGGYADWLPRLLLQVPVTIVFTWLYNKSGYSILSVILLHAMLNNSGKAFGGSQVVGLVLSGLAVAFCIVHDRMWQRKDYHTVYHK